ncbi:YcjF family protein [Acaryochloris marina NIES-2412]|uniref:YcjF family protein n=1 Tax=Acaryochloris marina TaxID=155978 RepID=UPI004059BAF8
MTDNFNFEDAIKDAIDEAFRERGHTNILIAGATGVGKSTLINAIFQGNFATTGQGRPVTQTTREIKKDGVPLSIFDSRGLEIADFSDTINELKSFLSERRQESDPNKHIHVAWVCIMEDSRRVQPAEEQLIEILSDYGIPVVAVISKARQDKINGQSFQSTVQSMLPLAKNVIRVRALPEEDDDGNVKPAMGLKELVELTVQLVPEGHKRAFTAAQKVNIKLKKNQSHIIVTSAATSAAGVALVPIPFADAVAIVPIQFGMLAGITSVFGLSYNEGFLSALVSCIATGAGGTLIGRAVVSNLLKLVPGGGSIAGGTIAAATAAAITTAFGEAYIATLVFLFTRNNGEPPTPEEVVRTFKQQYVTG